MIRLAKACDEVVTIRDDNDAKALLVEIGIHEELTKGGTLAGQRAEFLSFGNHPTHWILAIYYSGFADPRDNGYDVKCLPKSRFTFERFKQAIKAVAKTTFPDGIEYYRKPTDDPARN